MSIPVWVECDFCHWRFVLKHDFAPCRTAGCTKGLLLRPAKENEKYVRVECSVRVHYNRLPAGAKATKCHCCSEEFEIGTDVIEVRSKQNIYGSKRIESLKEMSNQNDPNKTILAPLQTSPSIDEKKKLEKEVDSLKGKILDLHKQLAEKRVESKDSAERSKKDAKKIGKLQDELKKMTVEMQQLLDRIFKLNFEKIVWDRKVETAEEDRKRMERKLQPLTTENNKLKYENMLMRNRMKADEMILKQAESENKELQNENEALKKTIENFKTKLIRKEKENEELKNEKTTLLSKGQELQLDVEKEKAMSSELQEIILNLKQELSQLKQDGKEMSEQNQMEKMIEELKMNLELSSEKCEQESAKELEEMKAQIKSLMETNLNLSTALAKVDMNNAENVKNNVGPWLVPCDVCGVKETIPKDHWAVHCKEESCSGNVTIICAPARDGYRVVRHKCKNLEYYNLLPYDQKTLQCACCQREFKISNAVTEVRNKQKVFRAELDVLPEEEIADLKNKIKEVEKNHENEVKRMEQIIMTMPNEHKKNHEAHMEQVYGMINENKRLNEEVKNKKKIQKELEVIKANNSYYARINTMLMKRLAGFERAAK